MQKQKCQDLLFECKYGASKSFKMVLNKQSKQSLSHDKTRFTLFHRLQDRDHFPLQMPVLKTNDYKIEIFSSIIFIRVMADEHLG